MATISVEKTHRLSEDEAVKRAEQICEDIGDRFDCSIVKDGKTFSFKGKGFSGAARVVGDRVAIDVDLSLVLRPLKGKIEDRIHKAIEEKFA